MNQIENRMIRIGIVGLGYMGAHHLKILDAMKRENIFPNIDIHLISDPDADRLNMWSKKYNIQGSVNPDDVLESESINTVFIASPPAFHRDQAIKALSSNKAVYLEKPMGLTLDDAVDVAGMARKTGMQNQVGLVLNHSPMFRYLQELLHHDELGKPVSFTLRHATPLPSIGLYKTDWKQNRKHSGGLLREGNVHDIDFILNLFGDYSIQSVDMHVRKDLGEDHVRVEMECDSGVHGLFETERFTDAEQKGKTKRNFEVICENGSIHSHSFFFNGPVTYQINGKEAVTEEPARLSEQYLQNFAIDPKVKRLSSWYSSLADYSFIRNLSMNNPCAPDFEQGLKVERKIQDIYDYRQCCGN